jgi:hypothetical protein
MMKSHALLPFCLILSLIPHSLAQDLPPGCTENNVVRAIQNHEAEGSYEWCGGIVPSPVQVTVVVTEVNVILADCSACSRHIPVHTALRINPDWRSGHGQQLLSLQIFLLYEHSIAEPISAPESNHLYR